MDINAGLVDQRVQQIRADYRAALVGGDAKLQNDEPKLTSRAFTALCVSTLLDLPLDEACGKLTDASHDLAIDALHVEGLRDGEFGVVLFQAKYRQKFDGASSFPANDVIKVLQTVSTLFDPNKRYDERTPLAARVEEIRSLIREGFLPTVRVVLCNNGQAWTGDAQAHIDAAGLPDDQVTFEHLGPARIVSLLRAPKPVDDTLRLKGKALVEDFDFRRVLVGKMAVTEVAALFERHGERLLERNIRRYLGLGSNRVNQAIARTLRDPAQRGDFYFFNNGITLTCAKFRHNALQGDDHQVRVEDLQVINGGQTCVTIQRVLASLDPADFDRAFVIVRLYELEDDDHEIVRAITYATNSQNPVDLRDLRSNDAVQQQLAMGLQALGYTYQRKRSVPGAGADAIWPQEAAEAVMAIIREKPHVARFHGAELFGRRYDEVFGQGLLPAQVALAVEVRRRVAKLAKNPPTRAPIEGLPDPPRWLPYAELAIAMLVGREVGAADVDHRNFPERLTNLEFVAEAAFLRAVDLIDLALLLDGVHVGTATLQRLSAVFRRGDLLGEVPATLERAGAVEWRAGWSWNVLKGWTDLFNSLPEDRRAAADVEVREFDQDALERWRALLSQGDKQWIDEAGVAGAWGLMTSLPLGAAWISELWRRLTGSAARTAPKGHGLPP